MTVLPSKNTTSSDESPPLEELRRLKSQAQNGEYRRQLRREQREAAKKAEHKDNKHPDPEPQQSDTSKPKRKKRGFFKWLFEPAVATSRKVAPPPAPRVRVKIPIVYRNGEHKGVVVGGLRVPFSRPMQANRRSLLLAQDDARFGIPEDAELVLDFPDRLAWEAYEAEQSRKQEEKQRLKVEKLARELAK
ncbi:40S ribosomal protein S8 [Phytophthora cinnamomi]|uniref:40S ribosomal protein S8 n=1 Tax=Phytophthora cinnamomi TaxID=4785 RepID=UPI003559E5D2|nr:40S ribosomal protein S8 [Phytophthora cinnamomi]